MKFLLLGLALLLLTGPDEPKADKVSAALLGRWEVVKAGTPKPLPSGGHWVFEEKTVEMHRSDVSDGIAKYSVNAADKPNSIDLVLDDGPAKGKTLKGIFEIDGKKLRICYVAPNATDPEKVARPRDFMTDGTVVFVFKRIGPSKRSRLLPLFGVRFSSLRF
jgi:uncharacterized protein (TIGR03067 family)